MNQNAPPSGRQLAEIIGFPEQAVLVSSWPRADREPEHVVLELSGSFGEGARRGSLGAQFAELIWEMSKTGYVLASWHLALTTLRSEPELIGQLLVAVFRRKSSMSNMGGNNGGHAPIAP